MKPQAQTGFELKCNPKTSDVDLKSGELPRSSSSHVSGRALLGYRRRQEKDKNDGEGEDYAWLKADENQVVAVLADGVSQSFFGQIAAQQVVRGLAKYLNSGNSLEDQQELEDALRSIAQNASIIVKEYQLRPNLSSTMRDLLEEERANGSQTVFGAFVFDRATRQLVICQVGDVRIRVFSVGMDGKMTHAIVDADKMGRFSTVTTANYDDASLHNNIVVRRFENVAGVLIHSDGVDDRWGEHPAALESSQEQELRSALDRWGDGDDASIVGVMTHPFLRWASNNQLAFREPKPAGGRFIVADQVANNVDQVSLLSSPAEKRIASGVTQASCNLPNTYVDRPPIRQYEQSMPELTDNGSVNRAAKAFQEGRRSTRGNRHLRSFYRSATIVIIGILLVGTAFIVGRLSVFHGEPTRVPLVGHQNVDPKTVPNQNIKNQNNPSLDGGQDEVRQHYIKVIASAVKQLIELKPSIERAISKKPKDQTKEELERYLTNVNDALNILEVPMSHQNASTEPPIQQLDVENYKTVTTSVANDLTKLKDEIDEAAKKPLGNESQKAWKHKSIILKQVLIKIAPNPAGTPEKVKG